MQSILRGLPDSSLAPSVANVNPIPVKKRVFLGGVGMKKKIKVDFIIKKPDCLLRVASILSLR